MLTYQQAGILFTRIRFGVSRGISSRTQEWVAGRQFVLQSVLVGEVALHDLSVFLRQNGGERHDLGEVHGEAPVSDIAKPVVGVGSHSIVIHNDLQDHPLIDRIEVEVGLDIHSVLHDGGRMLIAMEIMLVPFHLYLSLGLLLMGEKLQIPLDEAHLMLSVRLWG